MKLKITDASDSRRRFDGARAFMIIQLLLVLLLPFLWTQMSGCQPENDTLALNLGPEVSGAELDSAISKPLELTNPISIKLGEAFVVSETQEIGAGAAFAVLSDTAQTVIERTENSAEILLTVIETKQKYVNGQVQKSSTEIPYRIEKAPADAGVSSSSKKNSHDLDLSAMLHNMKPNSAVEAKSGIAPSAERVTYHGLTVSSGLEDPPELVQKTADCLGIPACKIMVHHVNFDMVFWTDGKPERVHWELTMSPDVPYLASMLNKCVTGIVKLSSNQGDVLVKQCLPVVNFRYVQ